MTSPSGRYSIAFNGEIYNFRRIRAEDHRIDKVVKGDADTEVFLRLIELVGLEQAIARSNGAYAFALFDSHLGKLTLCRDQFGEKPLYYTIRHVDGIEVCLFASELSIFRALRGLIELEIDEMSILQFSTLGYIPSPRSIYLDCHKVTPGTCLDFSNQPGKLSVWKHSEYISDSLDLSLIEPKTEGAWIELVDETFDRVISEYVNSSVDAGILLSGGVDSTYVARSVARLTSGQLSSFNVSFGDSQYDESDYAAEVARELGLSHNSIRLSSEDCDSLFDMLPKIYDEPFGDSSAIPSIFISKFASRSVKVVLTGDGGDEIFGGYQRYINAPMLWTSINLLPSIARAPVFGGIEYLASQLSLLLNSRGIYESSWNSSIRRTLERVSRIAGRLHSVKSYEELYMSFISDISPGSNVINLSRDQYSKFTETMTPRFPTDCSLFFLKMMYWDRLHYLPDDILVKMDRASMSSSIEARAPFLDRRVVSLAAKIDPQFLVRGGQGKYLLRKSLEKDFGKKISSRSKTGFGIPLRAWLGGKLKGRVSDLLSDKSSNIWDYYSWDTFKTYWSDTIEGRADRSRVIWNALVLDNWFKANG